MAYLLEIVSEHPPSVARRELLRYRSLSGRPCPLPGQPRTAGEKCRGPRASARRPPEPNRQNSNGVGASHCGGPGRPRATRSMIGAGPIGRWGKVLPYERPQRRPWRPRQPRNRKSHKTPIFPNPRRGKRVKAVTPGTIKEHVTPNVRTLETTKFLPRTLCDFAFSISSTLHKPSACSCLLSFNIYHGTYI